MVASICTDGFEAKGSVAAVCRDTAHRFSKPPVREIELVAGLGVRGDAHAGAKVQHRSRVRVDPDQPNLRQVHLLHRELFDELAAAGFAIAPGDLGENVTTVGLDLLALPRGTHLRLGDHAIVEVTGLRNPCAQIERFAPGLLAQVARRGPDGEIERLAGIMGIVVTGGCVSEGDRIAVRCPPPPHLPLERV